MDGAYTQTFKEKVERHGKTNEQGEWEEDERKVTAFKEGGNPPEGQHQNLKTLMDAHGDTDVPEGCVAVQTSKKTRTQNGEKITTQETKYIMQDGSTSTKSITNTEKLALKND